MNIRIIVNADDLGISETVNDAIFRSLERGAITSATLLSNGPAIEKAANRVHEFPTCSFGAHLNLTQFRPVCANTLVSLSALLDDNNHFDQKAIWQLRVRVPQLKAIYQEWCAQIDNLLRLGVRLSHLDTHQHVHTIPTMLPVLTALRRRYHINKIRITRNMYDLTKQPSAQLLAKKWLYNRALRLIRFKTAEAFTDLRTFVNLCALHPPRSSVIELSTHPGAEQNSEESRLLEDDMLHKLPYDVRLVSYDML